MTLSQKWKKKPVINYEDSLLLRRFVEKYGFFQIITKLHIIANQGDAHQDDLTTEWLELIRVAYLIQIKTIVESECTGQVSLLDIDVERMFMECEEKGEYQ